MRSEAQATESLRKGFDRPVAHWEGCVNLVVPDNRPLGATIPFKSDYEVELVVTDAAGDLGVRRLKSLASGFRAVTAVISSQYYRASRS